jgi:alpha-beta hydrolase superfamily lysophospholipase
MRRMSDAATPSQLVVLVHGAWHGGWCYRDTARLLRMQGHTVITPTHTGVGERAQARPAAAACHLHPQPGQRAGTRSPRTWVSSAAKVTR